MKHQCQSCGMLFVSNKDRGIEIDGSSSDLYCVHCFKNGAFTFTGTYEEFIEKQVSLGVSIMDLSEKDAREIAVATLPKLFRWKTESINPNSRTL